MEVRLPRHAPLARGAPRRAPRPALDRARDVWAGPPAVAESVELVYQDGAFPVPVPAGRHARPRPDAAMAEPLSRLGWVVRGRVRGGPRQMIGLLDYRLGPRRLEHPAPADRWPRERPAAAAPGPAAARAAPAHEPRSSSLGGILAAMLGGVVLVSALAIHSVAENLDEERAQGDPPRPEHPHLRQGQEAPRDRRRRDQPHRGRRAAASPRSSRTRPSRSRTSASTSTTASTTTACAGAAVRDLAERLGQPGRQHDHDAADQEPLRPARRAARSPRRSRRRTSPTSTRRGTRRTRSSRKLPQRRLLRPERRRRAGRVAHLLRQATSPRSTCRRPPCWPACRRPRPATTRSATPRRRGRGATWCSTRWPTRATSPRSAPTRPRWPGLALKRGDGLQAQARGVLLRVRPPGADRPLRREARPAGRLPGLHDHRPGAAVGGPHGHQGEPVRRRRPGRRRS